MVTFGDYELEDAYDAGDPVPVCLGNVARRLELLDGRPPVADLETLAARLRVVLGRRLDDVDRLRAVGIAADLVTLRARLDEDGT